MSSNTVNQRVNFASTKNPLEYPDFLEVQLKSFKDFLQLDTPPEKRKNEGLYKVFAENFPIADTRNNFVLEFLDYYIDPPRYTIDECIERGLTYSVPLKAKLKLYCTDPDHEDFDTVIQDVFLGPIPYMTDKATFVINGAERVVVSQLHRSPGVFFGQSVHANGTKLYSARIIPFKGSWIEFATDINNVMYAYIDRKKKLPVTTLLRAIGFENDKDILEIFNLAHLEKSSLDRNVLHYNRVKTKTPMSVEILDTAKDMIDQLWNRQPAYPDCPDYLFSILNGDKKRKDESTYREYQSALRNFNNHLRGLTKALHLTSPVTSYTIRHSWATTAKYRGVPIEMISESLGHKSIKTTQIYLKGFALKERTEVNKMNLSYVKNCLVKRVNDTKC